MERKQFLGRLLLGTGSAMILSPLASCEKEDSKNDISGDIIVDLTEAKNSNLLNEGGFIYVSGIIVANAGNNEFIALASSCPHQGCPVTFSLPLKKFPCTCHESEFSSTGSVLQGPATRSLRKYNVVKDGNKLIIS